MSETDALLKDNKAAPNSGFWVAPKFLAAVLLGLPIWLAVLLPFTLLWKLLSLPCQFCAPKPKPMASEETEAAAATAAVLAAAAKAAGGPPPSYELVLLGATGFTGQLCASYLAKNYSVRYT
jgi:hypothetical protein